MVTQEVLNKIKLTFGENNVKVFGIDTNYVSVNLIWPRYIITFNAFDGECYVADSKFRDYFFKSIDKAIEYIKSKM